MRKCNTRDKKTAEDVCSDEQKPIADRDPSHCVPLLRWRGRLGGQENSLRRLVGGAHQRDEPEKEKSRSCCGAAVHRSCSRRASTRANMTPNMQFLLRKCIFDFAKCCQCLPKLANVGERPCTLEVCSSAVFLKLALCL